MTKVKWWNHEAGITELSYEERFPLFAEFFSAHLGNTYATLTNEQSSLVSVLSEVPGIQEVHEPSTDSGGFWLFYRTGKLNNLPFIIALEQVPGGSSGITTLYIPTKDLDAWRNIREKFPDEEGEDFDTELPPDSSY